jgi:hypothetical protein
VHWYDGSEEAVDWLVLGLYDAQRLSLGLYDGSEEAVALLCFAPAFDGSEEACRCCRRLLLCERLSVWLLLLV